MKKLFVLLLAAAVAVGASAGVKLTNNTKANVKDLKAMNICCNASLEILICLNLKTRI